MIADDGYYVHVKLANKMGSYQLKSQRVTCAEEIKIHKLISAFAYFKEKKKKQINYLKGKC